MRRIVGFVLSLALVYFLFEFTYYYPSTAIFLLDALVTTVKGITYVLPSPWHAEAQIALRLVIPGALFFSVIEFGSWGLIWLYRACGYLYDRYQKPPYLS